jgi:type IV pilus assembly protein PilB
MFEGHDQAIYELLAERRLVEPASLQGAFDEHRATGKPLATMLLDLGLLDKPALLRAVADHIGCDFTEKLPATLPGE